MLDVPCKTMKSTKREKSWPRRRLPNFCCDLGPILQQDATAGSSECNAAKPGIAEVCTRRFPHTDAIARTDMQIFTLTFFM